MFDPSQFGTLEEVAMFVQLSENLILEYSIPQKEKHQWIRDRLIRFRYRQLRRREQGLFRRFLSVVTGYSPAQLSRHIRAYRNGERIDKPQRRRCFPTIYTRFDSELLAETDNLHGRLNGAATVKIMEEEYRHGDDRYERLRGISVSRLYDLRHKRRYVEEALSIEKTKPVRIPIGERRKPQPDGMPGFLRVDTVHQGDFEKEKGVYHINLVDEVTQWEVVMAVEQISESRMEEALMEAFPMFACTIQNYHSDNGGENINYRVAALFKKLTIGQTKSRPRHSNDNGLVETKNGSIVRKHMGYSHIPQPFASRINRFYVQHFIPYLNFHRPCAFPKIEILPGGKKKITYPPENYMTPYAKLKSLPNWQQYLRPGVTPERLEVQANAKTPNQAARELQEAKQTLMKIIGLSAMLHSPRLH
jgi:transposase InsO family protein